MLLLMVCKHVLFISLILFKIKECAVMIPRANQLIIILSEATGKEQVSSYIFVLWCKWEKKLEGIIKMSLAFHLKKTQEMRERGQKRKS
jgi:nitrate reductase NapAB chaperone NapD